MKKYYVVGHLIGAAISDFEWRTGPYDRSEAIYRKSVLEVNQEAFNKLYSSSFNQEVRYTIEEA